jgi:tRNA(Ser,Leu) C12 N-acetylase TAN1
VVDLLVVVDIQVLKDHRAYKDFKDPKVILEVVVFKDNGDIQDIQEAEVSLEA